MLGCPSRDKTSKINNPNPIFTLLQHDTKAQETWDQGLLGHLKEAQVERGSPLPPLVCLLQIALEGQGQLGSWVTKVERKNCDVNGLSLLSVQEDQRQKPDGQFKGRGPRGAKRGTTALGRPRPGRQGTWAEAVSACQPAPTLGPPSC